MCPLHDGVFFPRQHRLSLISTCATCSDRLPRRIFCVVVPFFSFFFFFFSFPKYMSCKMENEIFTPLLEQFMSSPLVTWVSGCSLWHRWLLLLLLLLHYLWPQRWRWALRAVMILLFQVKTFGSLAAGNGTNLEEYVALVDGVFLNQVMLHM